MKTTRLLTIVACLAWCGLARGGERPSLWELKGNESCSDWLGPQSNVESERELGRVVIWPDVDVIRRKHHEHTRSLEIELRVVQGRNLKVPPTQNGYVTLINGAIGVVNSEEALGIHKDAFYVLATACRHKREGVHHLYVLNLQVADGPFQEAIVQLRNGDAPNSSTEPYVAVYRIPRALEVKEGPLAFKVVATWAK